MKLLQKLILLVALVACINQPIKANDEVPEENKTLLERLEMIREKMSAVSKYTNFQHFIKELTIDQYEETYCTYVSDEDWREVKGLLVKSSETIYDIDQQKELSDYYIYIPELKANISLKGYTIDYKDDIDNQITYLIKQERYDCNIPYVLGLEEPVEEGSTTYSVTYIRGHQRIEIKIPLIDYYYSQGLEEEVNVEEIRSKAYELFSNRFDDYQQKIREGTGGE